MSQVKRLVFARRLLTELIHTGEPVSKKHINDNTPAHLRFQTQYSRTGKVSLHNRKPYRTKKLKAEARSKAYKCEDGMYRAPLVPVLYHQPPREVSVD